MNGITVQLDFYRILEKLAGNEDKNESLAGLFMPPPDADAAETVSFQNETEPGNFELSPSATPHILPIIRKFSQPVLVVLFTAKRSFRATALEVSSEGILLRDFIPSDFKNQELDLLIVVEQGGCATIAALSGPGKCGKSKISQI